MSTIRREINWLAWFARLSWSYLGCNRGTGRWAARARYVRSFIPTYLTWHRLGMEDMRAGFWTEPDRG
jgi:hypothetical protein